MINDKLVSRSNTLLACILFAAFSVAIPLAQPRTASALSGSDFKPGRIIDDQVFYNRNAMTQAQIQDFLNAKLPVCDTNGDKLIYDSSRGDTVTRKVYSERRGVSTPFICLKSYVQTTTTKSSDGFCNGHTSGSKNSARIIYEVAQSCGVSPKVLLVLLQKEQSLVTDDWPWPVQYRSATGYGCPDTAACDSQYYGFFNQVYMAAWQYKVYRAYPHSYNHIAGRSNYILYNPNHSCGGTNVFIENQATAGLYNYTPYQPNAAALNKLYESGNSCSAYGNRNFWRMYNDWFGSTLTPDYTYAAEITSQKIYSDAGRTIEVTGAISRFSGETLYATIEAKNTGSLAWGQSFTKVATTSPYNRTSGFRDSSWIEPNRPARLVESTVAYGQTGTFEFSLTTPSADGDYSEAFTLVAEGKRWMQDKADFSVPIKVSNPYNAIITELKAYKDAAHTQPTSISYLLPDQIVYVRIKAKNRGTQTWEKSYTKMATRNPDNRQSVFRDSSWIEPNRPARLVENTVATGQTGTFEFSLTAPSTLGDYNETFGPVADGQTRGWMPSAMFSRSITVTDTLDTLNPGQRLLGGEALRSRDGQYKLILQGDGNLVLYSPSRAIWASYTQRNAIGSLVMQGDGNLVLYNSNGKPLWHTHTNGKGASRLVMQSDGNLVLYDSSGRATWHTHTNGKE